MNGVRGFVEAFQRSGLPVPQDLIRSQSLSVDFGFREATALFQMKERPTAIIAAGNRILVGVLRAIQQQGVSVPADISLIGCDRSHVALLYPGPITLIDRAVEEIGRTAAQLLLERLGGQRERPAQRIAFPTHLILGGSCLPVPK
ncbi:substrate-binding domain-containing protein [Mesorhizobium sp. M0894]|uniref:substrate-binding domain-containing protein n=1 Tax=unclassified Mesorhizobium TaxID=325217 RepID=UPI003337FED2